MSAGPMYISVPKQVRQTKLTRTYFLKLKNGVKISSSRFEPKISLISFFKGFRSTLQRWTGSQASYHSASSSPSARRPFSAFDGVNEEANVRTNAAVVPGYADVRASATDDNNDDVDDCNFDDTLSEILGTSSRVATSPNLDLDFGAVDVNVDLACTSLLSPLSHLPPPTSSPPSSAAAGEPI